MVALDPDRDGQMDGGQGTDHCSLVQWAKRNTFTVVPHDTNHTSKGNYVRSVLNGEHGVGVSRRRRVWVSNCFKS